MNAIPVDFFSGNGYNGVNQKRNDSMPQYDTYESPLGTLYLAGESGILTNLSFDPIYSCEEQSFNQNEFEAVKQWLDAYFRGEDVFPDFPMKQNGTPFQQLIWKLLLKIPFGQTVTYGDLARQAAQILGREKMSAQAVGQAVGHNPIAVIIPCHRVVGAGGKLTGYAYGIHIKKLLLQHEQEERVCAMQNSDISKQND